MSGAANDSRAAGGGAIRRLLDHDLMYSFLRSPLAVVAAVVTGVIFIATALAPWVAPHEPFIPATLSLMDAFTVPAWMDGGSSRYILGTDDLGRDVLSTIMHGARISIIVGFSAVMLGMTLGVGLGVLSGYLGGWFEIVVMRLADIQLTIPGILVALLIDGVARALLPREVHADVMIYVIILAIGLSDWPQFARVTRSATLVEKRRDYVSAARLTGIGPMTIMIRHILPNVMRPVLVLATVGLALAIIAEATLSFLGVGMPPTTPSLGTLIRVGGDFLYSGEWWITLFPALVLVILVLAVNLLGDWLRDALDPKLRY